MRVARHHSCWVSPFGNPRIHARLTAPRGISQPPTSFIGSRCQGIHHAPLDTYKHNKTKEYCTKNTPPLAGSVSIDARNHYPVLKHHTPPPRRWDNTWNKSECCLRTQQCVGGQLCCHAPGSRPLQTRTPHGLRPTSWGVFVVLLRKEVIQPHLPVRLPCYDFVPIADPTFDSSLPRVRPLASGVTDFHDVTGGVYKARERIHRSVADLRLLATPTSRGRVADPDPN